MITSAKPGGLFAILFIVSAATLTALAAYLPEAVINWWLSVTMITTTLLGQLFGATITTNGDIMTVNGFAMRIITQCTALHYVIILTIAMLLYARHNISYRLTGLLICIPLIIIANAMRLVITGVIGSISWDAFVIVHDYLWIAAFSLLLMAMWIVWADKMICLTYRRIKRGLLTLLLCTGAYVLLYFSKTMYGHVIAKLGTPLFRVFITDPTAQIWFDGSLMQFRYSGGRVSANFVPDLMVAALYLGYMLSGDARWPSKFKLISAGFLIIMGMSVVIITGGGSLAAVSEKELALVFLWTGHGLLLSLSYCLWWLFHLPKKPMEYSPQ